jgi:hypothetical protein
MEKRNVEICYCRGDGPVTRVSSCNPGLRRGAPRRRRGRSDARRQIWATMASGVLVLIGVGSDADWRAKLLVYLAVEGPPLDAYSQSAFPL